MAIECAVITAIFIVFAVIFIRRHHKQWAFATLPLMLVPFTELVMEILFVKVFKMSVSVYWAIFALIVAVAVSCAWIGLMSGGMKNRRTKVYYIVITNAFNVLLAAILCYNILDAVNSFVHEI